MQASEVQEKLRLVLDTRCGRFAAVVLLARLLRDAGEGLGMATSAVIAGAARWLRLSPAESVLLFLASELSRRVRMPWEPYELEKFIARAKPEDALDPRRRVIDPHHHLWDPVSAKKDYWHVPWKLIRFFRNVRGTSTMMLPSFLSRSYGEELRAPFVSPYNADEMWKDVQNRAAGRGGVPHNVVATVFIESHGWKNPAKPECLWWDEELDYALAERRKNPVFNKGIVLRIDLNLGEQLKPALDYYSKYNVAGFRHPCDEDPKGVFAPCTCPLRDFDAIYKAVRLIGEYGMSLDFWHSQNQIPTLIKLAEAAPDTVIIADHLCGPLGVEPYYNRAQLWEGWKDGIRKLSACKNVRMKLSGLGMKHRGFGYDDRSVPPTSEEMAKDWKRYILHAIDCFGVRRCMFASNFPVDKISGDYTAVFNAFKVIVRDFSEADKHALFFQTANETYKL
eukprot:gene21044-32421_t